jgi:hypothetical protein
VRKEKGQNTKREMSRAPQVKGRKKDEYAKSVGWFQMGRGT